MAWWDTDPVAAPQTSTVAGASVPARSAAKSPTFAQRFVAGLSAGMGDRSEAATINKFAPGETSQEFYGDSYAKPLATAARAISVGVPSIAAGVLAAPTGPAGVGLAAGGAGYAADLGVDLLARTLGGEDRRSPYEGILSHSLTGASEATAATAGPGIEQLIRKGVGRLLSGGGVLREGAQGLLQRMSAQGQTLSRGAIFEEPTSRAAKAAAQATENVVEALPPTARSEADVGQGLIAGAASRASALAPRGNYFSAIDAQYLSLRNAATSGNMQQQLPVSSFMNELQAGLQKWRALPAFGDEASLPSRFKKFAQLVQNSGQMTIEQAVDYRDYVGGKIRDTLVRGETLPKWANPVYRSLTEDLERFFASKGQPELDAWKQASSIYKNSMDVAESVGKIANSGNPLKAFQLASSDLSPEALRAVQEIAPAHWNGFVSNVGRKLGMLPGTDTAPAHFDLSKFFAEYQQIDPVAVDMLWPKGSKFRGAADEALQIAHATGFYGRDTATMPQNAILNYFKNNALDIGQKAGTLWADSSMMLNWFAKAGAIQPADQAKLVAWAARLPNATFRNDLVKYIVANPPQLVAPKSGAKLDIPTTGA